MDGLAEDSLAAPAEPQAFVAKIRLVPLLFLIDTRVHSDTVYHNLTRCQLLNGYE